MQVQKLLLILLLSGVTLANSVTVNTQSGTVVGSTVYHNGKTVKRYLGIPYAEPPVGNLRFKKTRPVQFWSKPLIANTFPPSCIQYYPFQYPWYDGMNNKSENCLYLNIWVPENNTSNFPKTVMFWIFSGGFSSGSNRLPVYDGHVLAAEGDVIVVTINYRLGIFGFLSTSSEEAPGNMGLFDILEALKWINMNIEKFGGNSKSISVFGQSAGSIASGYLIVSPLAKGLFQRAIMESGAPSPVHMDNKRKNLLLGQEVAKQVGCPSDFSTIENYPNDFVSCLREKSAEDLIKVVFSIKKTSVTTFDVIYGDEFLPFHPYETLQNGSFQHVEIMIGNVRDEGSFKLGANFPEVFGPFGEKNPRINKTYGRELIIRTFQGITNAYEIADYYLAGLREEDYDIVRSQAYHAYGDYQLFCTDLYFALTFSGKVYFYYYNHQSANTVFAPWTGVAHFAEVPFVFGRPLDYPSSYTEEEKKLSEKIMALWTNFAKNGFPSPTWEPFSSPKYHTEKIQINDDYDNYLVNHICNCVFLSKYLFN